MGMSVALGSPCGARASNRGGATMRRPAEPRPLPGPGTTELLSRLQDGDRAALEPLLERCLPPLQRWARGRLPRFARDLMDTDDLVQDSVVRALRNLEAFEARFPGALHAYLRQAVFNRIRDAVRRVVRRPAAVELPADQRDPGASPLEQAIGREGIERYEAALQRLRPRDQEAIVGRLELQYSYEELAALLGKPSANAARVAVTRALERLVEAMET